MSTDTAVTREANYLAASGDGLPALLKSAGGPFDVVQAYWSPTTGARRTRLFLVRGVLVETRWANQRKLDTYDFVMKLYWPIGATTTGSGVWETEQLAFDRAVDLVVQRIRGKIADHSHGAFLSVAEAPDGARIGVAFEDPERSAAATPAELKATITYSADDEIVA